MIDVSNFSAWVLEVQVADLCSCFSTVLAAYSLPVHCKA
jgi:hypothetical protein